MKNDQNIIDDLFRDALNDYREEKPSNNLWSRISMHMLLQMLSGGRVLSILLMSVIVLVPITIVINNNLSPITGTSIIASQDIIKEQPENHSPEIVQVNNNINVETHQTSLKKQITIKPVAKSSNEIASRSKLYAAESNSSNKKFEKVYTEKTVQELYFPNSIYGKSYHLDYTAQLENKLNAIQIDQTELHHGFSSPFAKSRLEVSAELWYSPSQVNKEIYTNLASLNDHVVSRTNNEKPITSANLGAELRLNYKNWIVQTGLNYTHLGEETRFMLPGMDIDTSYYTTYQPTGYWKYDTIDWFIDPDDPTIMYPVLKRTWKEDSIAFLNAQFDTILTETSYVSRNDLSYIEIPLLVGREFEINRFSIDVLTGISFGVLSGRKGRLLHYNNTDIIEMEVADEIFKETILNYNLRIGGTYHLTHRLGITARPSFRYNLTSIFDEKYPVGQKYHTFGVEFGVRYRLY